MRCLLAAALLLTPLLVQGRQGEDGVRSTEYRKLQGCWEVRAAGKRVVVSPTRSGTVLYYGGESNLLREAPEEAATGSYGELSLVDLPTAPSPAVASPWTVGPPGPSRVTLVAPPQAASGGSVRVEKDVELDPRSGDLHMLLRITAPSAEAPTPVVARSRISLPAGGYALSPTNPAGRYRATWALATEGRLDGDTPSEPRAHVGPAGLVAECRGADYQAVTDSPAGWVAYIHGRSLLVVRFSGVARMVTGDGGWNVSVGMTDGGAELTVRSPEMQLRRTATYSFPVRWSVTRLPSEVKSVAQAQAALQDLVGRMRTGK